jgi:DNA-binding transcriptional MerR regulator
MLSDMSTHLLTMAELLDAVIRETSHLEVKDGRVGDAITERTVRYYVTIGVVRPPLRDGNTRMWSKDHVNDLIRVRRAQHNGEPLKAVRRQIEAESQSALNNDSWRMANSTALRFSVLQNQNLNMSRSLTSAFNLSARRQSPMGWMVPISPTLHLSGFGAPPTDDELDAVRAALRERISSDSIDIEIHNINTTTDNKDNQ